MTQYWWITTNPKEWHWEKIYDKKSGEEFFYKRERRIKRHFDAAQAGDFIFGYLSSPCRKIVALARVKKGLHVMHDESDILGEGILIERIGNSLFQNPIPWAILREELRGSEPIKNNAQGTLFSLNVDEARRITQLLKQEGSAIYPPLEEILKKDTDTG